MPTPAVRNNNPGNLKNPKTGTFQQFSSPQEGYDALVKDLTGKMTGATSTGLKPTSSLRDFSSTWAPASDKNNPEQYAQKLSKQLGVSPDTPIGSLKSRVDDFAKAVATDEDPSGSQVATLSKATPQNEAVSGGGNIQPQTLSHDQLKANIDAMEQQGAKPEEVQGYLDNLKQGSTAFNPKPFSNPDSSPGQVDFSGTSTPSPETPKSSGILNSIGNAVGEVAKSVASPVATMLARPFQAGAELFGADSKDVDKFSSNISGGLIAPVPQDSSDVMKDVGRGAETVSLGLGPVPGGALFGAGNSVEQGNSPLSGQTALQGILGGAGGKVLDVAAPYISKTASAIAPKFVKDAIGGVGSALSPAVKGASDFMKNTQLPYGKEVSNVINKGAESVNETPGLIGNAVKGQYGLGEGSTKQDALGMIQKIFGSTGKKSAGVMSNEPSKMLSGAETLVDNAPKLKVTDLETGSQIPYDPTTATPIQHVEALNNGKKATWAALEDNLKSATGQGVEVDTLPTQKSLVEIINSKGRVAEHARAQELLGQLQNLKTPTEINDFLVNLNAGNQGVANGTAQAVNRKLDYEITQKLAQDLDGSIINIKDNSSVIRKLKNTYSGYKNAETSLVNLAKKYINKKDSLLGGGLLDYANSYNLGDIFSHIASGNPVGAVGSLLRTVALNKIKGNQLPETQLQKLFQTISNYKGISGATSPVETKPVQNAVTGGLIKSFFPQNQ